MNNFSQDVLGFWFEELDPSQHFVSSPALDATIRARFLSLYETLVAQPMSGDAATADALLAAIIVLYQFPHNMFRGTPRAFASDPLALTLTHHALQRGLDTQIDEDRRAFLYMPLMHVEDLTAQDLCVSLFDTLGGNPHAVEHREVIAQFGRFPHRNAIFGRASSEAELAYLETGSRFGQ